MNLKLNILYYESIFIFELNPLNDIYLLDVENCIKTFTLMEL